MASPVRSFVIAAACCLGLLAGCDLIDAFSDSGQHSGPIAADLEAAFGKKPFVLCAGKGAASVVTIAFSGGAPDASLAEVEKVARAAAVRELKSEPATLMLQFTFSKTTSHPDLRCRGPRRNVDAER